MKRFLVLFLGGVLLCGAGEVPSYLRGYETQYARNPRQAAVEWFRQAKFGVFVHYALASLLERGKPGLIKLAGDDEVMGLVGERPEVLKKLSSSNPAARKALRIKRDLFERFDAKRFDAGRICDVAQAVGMRYITFTTQHLGGLYMYRTTVTKFTSLNSPAHRDLVAEMAAACRQRGLGLFLYVPPDVSRTDAAYLDRNRTLLRELLTQYGPIAGIWFDGIGHYNQNPENYTKLSETYAFVRNLQPQCLISFKDGANGEEDFRTPEHFLYPAPYQWKSKLRQQRWETKFQRWKKNYSDERRKLFRDMAAEVNGTMQECQNRDGVGEPGGWINDEQARHLSADEVMDLLAYARTVGANLLVNVGPRGDGSLHPADVRSLREAGQRIRESGFPGK